jgi:thiamine biosynthesis lipoprotein ApbE
MTTTTPIAASTEVQRATWSAIGCDVSLLVTDPAALQPASVLLRHEIDAVDRACSRFRIDSEVMQLHLASGRPVTISPLLAEAVAAALRAAEITNGLVDPTVTATLSALGYDRDFGSVAHDGPALPRQPARPSTWREIRLEPGGNRLTLPRGTQLDLGATAKALLADRAAARIAGTLGCGVLVSLGGDIATAGSPPHGGWSIRVQERPAPVEQGPRGNWCVISLTTGALATSSVQHRRWSRGDRDYHHIIDPRTGTSATAPWRTVSVTAASCVDANTASTCAVILGTEAEPWLRSRRLPARLVTARGRVETINGWPDDAQSAAQP